MSACFQLAKLACDLSVSNLEGQINGMGTSAKGEVLKLLLGVKQCLRGRCGGCW